MCIYMCEYIYICMYTFKNFLSHIPYKMRFNILWIFKTFYNQPTLPFSPAMLHDRPSLIFFMNAFKSHYDTPNY